MTLQRTALMLTIINLAILGGSFARTLTAQDAPPTVRARAWELIDDRGRVRASMEVGPRGDTVFRLRDATGTIRVKLAADQEGSGLLLLDDRPEPGVQLNAGTAGGSLTVTSTDGRQRVVEP